jgi:hypothetical protein
MRESRTYGSVRGALSNERPYRDPLRNPSTYAGGGTMGFAALNPSYIAAYDNFHGIAALL